MKRLIAVLFVVASSFAAGCMFHHDQVVGSGNRKREKREIAAFNSISTEGAFQIEVVSQQPLGLEIEADDNILPLITTDISGGVMHIKSKRGFSANQPIVLKISTPNLEGISASGAGTVDVSDLKNDKFDIDANGAPSIKVSGVTGTIHIEANGAGKIDAHKLRADKGTVEANGVARIEVFARDELNVTVSGPASVLYRGDPKLNKTLNGPGSIERRESEGS